MTSASAVEVPADLRARLEAARLDLLALFRALDRMDLTPSEIPQRLIRQLFELDADHVEALWALDPPPGTLDMKAMLRDTLAGFSVLSSRSSSTAVFFVGHTLGFRQSDPTWGVDTLLGSMRSIHFDVQGFSRTYWDLFVAAGFSVGVFCLFAAVLAWQLGGLPAKTLAVMRVIVWALALCFTATAVVSWRYLFIVPIVFSIVVHCV